MRSDQSETISVPQQLQCKNIINFSKSFWKLLTPVSQTNHKQLCRKTIFWGEGGVIFLAKIRLCKTFCHCTIFLSSSDITILCALDNRQEIFLQEQVMNLLENVYAWGRKENKISTALQKQKVGILHDREYWITYRRPGFPACEDMAPPLGMSQIRRKPSPL